MKMASTILSQWIESKKVQGFCCQSIYAIRYTYDIFIYHSITPHNGINRNRCKPFIIQNDKLLNWSQLPPKAQYKKVNLYKGHFELTRQFVNTGRIKTTTNNNFVTSLTPWSPRHRQNCFSLSTEKQHFVVSKQAFRVSKTFVISAIRTKLFDVLVKIKSTTVKVADCFTGQHFRAFVFFLIRASAGKLVMELTLSALCYLRFVIDNIIILRLIKTLILKEMGAFMRTFVY